MINEWICSKTIICGVRGEKSEVLCCSLRDSLNSVSERFVCLITDIIPVSGCKGLQEKSSKLHCEIPAR